MSSWGCFFLSGGNKGGPCDRRGCSEVGEEYCAAGVEVAFRGFKVELKVKRGVGAN